MLDPKHVLIVQYRNISMFYHFMEYDLVFTSVFGHNFCLTSYGVPFIYDKGYYDEYIAKNYVAKI